MCPCRVHLRPEDEYPADRLGTLTAEGRAYLDTIYVPHIHVRTFKGGNPVERQLDKSGYIVMEINLGK